MSSIVSRNPPPSGSTSQANDFFWISIRFGTSTDWERRANVRRVRGASTEAKTATPPGDRRGAGEGRERCQRHTRGPAKIAQGQTPRARALDSHGPRPARLPYVARGAVGRLRLSAGCLQHITAFLRPLQTGAAPRTTEAPRRGASGRVGDPGFEPGTSSLSEKRSNRLS